MREIIAESIISTVYVAIHCRPLIVDKNHNSIDEVTWLMSKWRVKHSVPVPVFFLCPLFVNVPFRVVMLRRRHGNSHEIRDDISFGEWELNGLPPLCLSPQMSPPNAVVHVPTLLSLFGHCMRLCTNYLNVCNLFSCPPKCNRATWNRKYKLTNHRLHGKRMFISLRTSIQFKDYVWFECELKCANWLKSSESGISLVPFHYVMINEVQICNRWRWKRATGCVRRRKVTTKDWSVVTTSYSAISTY